MQSNLTSGSDQLFNNTLKLPPPPNLTKHIVKIKDQYLAGGRFGDVYKCLYHGAPGMAMEVAVKSLRFSFTIDGQEDRKSTKMLRRELGIWRRLEHENIVPFLGIAYGFGMDGTMSLHDTDLALGHRFQILLDIANGLHYLHSIPIVHGDLSTNNVLLDADYRARLVDFGYATVLGNIPEAMAYLQRSTARPGALRWIAPEQLEVGPNETLSDRTTKTDIFSFGCAALQVLSGKQPWSEVREDAAVVLCLVKGHKPARPEFRPIDDSHWNLIQDCWSSSEKRPTAEEITCAIQRFLNNVPPFRPLRDALKSSSARMDVDRVNTIDLGKPRHTQVRPRKYLDSAHDAIFLQSMKDNLGVTSMKSAGPPTPQRTSNFYQTRADIDVPSSSRTQGQLAQSAILPTNLTSSNSHTRGRSGTTPPLDDELDPDFPGNDFMVPYRRPRLGPVLHTAISKSSTNETGKILSYDAVTGGYTDVKPRDQARATNEFDWAAAGLKAPITSAPTWMCSTCCLQNPSYAKEMCTICEAPRQPPSDSTSSVPVPASTVVAPVYIENEFDWAAAGLIAPGSSTHAWTCTLCGLQNPANAMENCTICDAPRPGYTESSLPSVSTLTMPEGASTSLDSAVDPNTAVENLTTYLCGWVQGNQVPGTCNIPVARDTVGRHLAEHHGVGGSNMIQCLWEGCGDERMTWQSLMRHILEDHLLRHRRA